MRWISASAIALIFLALSASLSEAGCPPGLANTTTANANDVMAWFSCKASLENPSFSGNIFTSSADSYQTLLSLNNSATGGHMWYVMSTGPSQGGAGRFSLWDATSGGQRFSIDTSGNVGIGAASDGSKLLVSGGNIAATSSDSYQTLLSLNNSSAGGHMWYVMSTGPNQNGAGRFALYDATGGGERLSIDTTGNVAIGGPSNGNRLSVNGGNIAATNSDTWQTLLSLTNTATGGHSWYVMSTGPNQSGAGRFVLFDATSGGERFSINTSGNAAFSGCITYNGGTTGTCLSDERLKSNIKPYTAGLSTILALRPITYKYNGLAETPSDGKTRTGLIAQQVKAVAPDLVSTVYAKMRARDANLTPLIAINYAALDFALINAIKELKAENDRQSKDIALLESQIRQMQAAKGRARETRVAMFNKE